MGIFEKKCMAKLLKNVFAGTFLSVLIFFSISFITFLGQIAPFRYYKEGREFYHLSVGFPLTFYEQFWLRGSELPNFGWRGTNLLLDCAITWLVVTSAYVFLNRPKR